jgi:hypothetical protein
VEIRPDGSPVWPDAVSSWVADQAFGGITYAVNETGEAEQILTASQFNTPEEKS